MNLTCDQCYTIMKYVVNTNQWVCPDCGLIVQSSHNEHPKEKTDSEVVVK